MEHFLTKDALCRLSYSNIFTFYSIDLVLTKAGTEVQIAHLEAFYAPSALMKVKKCAYSAFGAYNAVVYPIDRCSINCSRLVGRRKLLRSAD